MGSHRLAGLAAAALLLGAAALGAAGADGDDPNLVYEFEVPLAPVCIDGDLPFQLETGAADLQGVLSARTSVKGRVTGTLLLAGDSFTVSGSVKHRVEGSTLKLKAKGPTGRITLAGDVGSGLASGLSKGKSSTASGEGTFTIDLSDAPPTTAAAAVVFAPGSGAVRKGSATVTVCGVPLAVKATRSVKKGFRLDLRGGGFRWTGTAAAEGDPVSVAWTSKGWGAVAAGLDFGLAATQPPTGLSYADPAPLFEAEEPAAPDAALLGGGAASSWTSVPPLPAGLLIDPATGSIGGVPEAPSDAAAHVITASNLAGSSSTTVTVTVRGNRAYSFAPEQKTPTDDDLRHFLSRTHFGVRQDELDAVKAAGLDAYLDDQLDFQAGTAVEASAFAELVNATDPVGLEGGFPSGADVSRWWLRIMLETDRPMQEHLAFFWHDRIPVAWDVLGSGYTHFEVGYVNLLRHQGAGNLRDLLLAVARDPGMLVYLSGYQNTKNAPNENFAREFWELFTLGVDNGYTQADIVEAARAFTGWRLRLNAGTGQYYVEFDPNRHDTGSKTFFGTTIPGQNASDDFASVVDITLAQRPVAEFITARLFEEYCYEGPPQDLVDAMAASLRNGNWELKPFLKSLFLSEAFWSSRSRLPRVKTPLEYEVGAMRSTGLQLTVSTSDSWLSLLGHRPGLPPSVNGWPTGTLWYAPDGMVNRINFAYALVGDTTRQAAAGMNIADILPPPEERTDAAVLATLEGLMDLDLADAERTALLEYLNTVRQSDGTVVASPFDGTSQAQLDERVRGLVYILAQHPSYQVK